MRCTSPEAPAQCAADRQGEVRRPRSAGADPRRSAGTWDQPRHLPEIPTSPMVGPAGLKRIIPLVQVLGIFGMSGLGPQWGVIAQVVPKVGMTRTILAVGLLGRTRMSHSIPNTRLTPATHTGEEAPAGRRHHRRRPES